MESDLKERLAWCGVFLLAVGIGFFAGRISVKVDALSDAVAIKEAGQISEIVPTVTLRAISHNAVTGSYSGEVRVMGTKTTAEQRNGEFTLPLSDVTSSVGGSTGATALDANYPYVASKNSTLYHPITATAATRIKPENRVYFKTREEAEKRGFRPGSDVQ